MNQGRQHTLSWSPSILPALTLCSYHLTVGPSPPHDACGCPHGPIGDHCRHQQGVQYSSQCSASTSTSTSSSTNGYSGDYSTDSASDGSGSSSTSSSSNTANDKAVPEGSKALDPSGFSFWMLIAAAVSAAFAIGAIVVGQRKTAKEPHPLAGSVARRMGLFSNFANSALCSSVERPARGTLVDSLLGNAFFW